MPDITVGEKAILEKRQLSENRQTKFKSCIFYAHSELTSNKAVDEFFAAPFLRAVTPSYVTLSELVWKEILLSNNTSDSRVGSPREL